jgi:predicted RNA-binding protein Jag
MEKTKATIQRILELVGFKDFSINSDNEGRKIIIFINEGDWFKNWIPRIISDLNHLSRVLANKNDHDSVFVDVNNYRKERENIIIDIAKAAARKVVMTKGDVKLPAMNSYERRIIHLELATRPDVETESAGEGVGRCVIVKLLQ